MIFSDASSMLEIACGRYDCVFLDKKEKKKTLKVLNWDNEGFLNCCIDL